MFYKIFTHDYRLPVQGGEVLIQGGGPAATFNGHYPATLPEVMVDENNPSVYATGWNFCRNLAAGFRRAGMWQDGWPVRVAVVEPVGRFIERGDKCRAEQLRLIRPASPEEIKKAMRFGEAFGPFTDEMVGEQWAWFEALGRPLHDEAEVVAGLKTALERRGLGVWGLRRLEDASDAWAARADWNAKDAWAARGAWNAKDAWAAWNAWAASAAWGARDTSRPGIGKATRATRDASDALVVSYAARSGWIDASADALSAGIRDAYQHGLDIAVPLAGGVLGYTLV